jgi:CTP:phosphocholine cytidylyltransferase-like protein
LSMAGTVEISNSHFVNNSLNDIWLVNSDAVINNNTFDKGDEQSIYASLSNFNMTGNRFFNGVNFGVIGKAIYCSCITVRMLNNVFSNLGAA